MSHFSSDDYKIIKRDVLYQGRFCYAEYHIKRKQFNGTWAPILRLELLERPPAAAVLPYDPSLDQIVLIEQFRIGAIAHTHHPWLYEIVAGLAESDEDIQQMAAREMQEEAGLKLLDLHLIYDYFTSPGASNEYLHLFIGRVQAEDAGGIYGLSEENENIRATVFSFDEAIHLLQRGQFKNAPLILSLQWLQLNRKWLKEKWLAKK